jgi:hypothetical protein
VRKPLSKLSSRALQEKRVLPSAVLLHQIACGRLDVTDRKSVAQAIQVLTVNLLDTKVTVSLGDTSATRAGMGNALAEQLQAGHMSTKQVANLLQAARKTTELAHENIPTTKSVTTRQVQRAGFKLTTINTSHDRVDGTCVSFDQTILPLWLHSKGWRSVYLHHNNPCMAEEPTKLFVFGLPFDDLSRVSNVVEYLRKHFTIQGIDAAMTELQSKQRGRLWQKILTSKGQWWETPKEPGGKKCRGCVLVFESAEHTKLAAEKINRMGDETIAALPVYVWHIMFSGDKATGYQRYSPHTIFTATPDHPKLLNSVRAGFTTDYYSASDSRADMDRFANYTMTVINDVVHNMVVLVDAKNPIAIDIETYWI